MKRNNPNTLLAYQRAEHEKAEEWERIASWLDYPILLIAIAGVSLSNYGVWIAVLSLILGLGRYLSGYQSRKCQEVAERARRAVVLQNGLGIQLSGKAFSDLYSAFSAKEEEAAKYYEAGYYDSDLQRGPVRLAKLLEESAFWSKDLCRVAAQRASIKFAVALALSAISLLLIASNADETARILAVQVFCIVIVVLVTGGLFGSSVAFFRAAYQLDDVEGRIPKVPNDLEDVLPVFEDYNAVVQTIPVIPTKVYLERKETLNQLWRDREEGKDGQG